MAVAALAGLAFTALAVLFVVALAGTLLKLAFRILFFPLFLLKFLITGLVMLIVGPVLAIVGIVLAAALGLVLAVPLLPILVLAGVVWLVIKASRRPAAA